MFLGEVRYTSLEDLSQQILVRRPVLDTVLLPR